MIKLSQTADSAEIYNSANWHIRHVKFDTITQWVQDHASWLEDHMTADVMIMNWQRWPDPRLEIRFSAQDDVTFWDLSRS